MYKNSKGFNPREIRGSSTILDSFVKAFNEQGMCATLEELTDTVTNEKVFYYVFATDEIVKAFTGTKQVLTLGLY